MPSVYYTLIYAMIDMYVNRAVNAGLTSSVG